MGMPWGVSGCGKHALVGNVSDGDLLLGSMPSSSLLILHAINTVCYRPEKGSTFSGNTQHR